MRKVGTAQSSPSPMPASMTGSTALGGQPGKGPPQGSRLPSRLASQQQKETAPPRIIPRRSSSNATVNQIKHQHEQSRDVTPSAELKDQKADSHGRRPSITKREQVPPAPVRKSPTLEEDEYLTSSSSESESEDEEIDSRKNPRFKRFGKFSIHKPGLRDDEEDEEDESPAFLPISRGSGQKSRRGSGQDLSATLRLNAESPDARRWRPAEHQQTARRPVTTESSASSASSGVPVNLPTENTRRTGQAASPLSPRRTAEQARSSPRRSVGSGREASDDTPSMGSSFSDLDDASVTQSALEEALLSNMQQGGIASRMSTISRYF